MIDPDIYSVIRRYEQENKSRRSCAKETGISRDTVAKYWGGKHYPGEPRALKPRENAPKKEQICLEIKEMLEEEKKHYRRKQKLTARRIWELLRGKYPIAYSTIRQYMREITRDNKNYKSMVPLSFEPGEVTEVDFCEITAVINGEIRKVNIFCAVLKYSFRVFCTVVLNMKFYTLADAQVRAMESFGGTTKRIHYDNMTTAVKKYWGKRAITTDKFEILRAHYGFESVFMNIRAGNEKGSVENLCGISEKIFSPVPVVRSVKELDDMLWVRTIKYNEEHHIDGKPHPIKEMYEEEKQALQPLPAQRFVDNEIGGATVGSDQTIVFETNRYSVPIGYYKKKVTLKVFPFYIQIWFQGKMLAEHVRLIGQNGKSYNPVHYVEILGRKKRAIRNAAPLSEGILTPEIERFKEKYDGSDINMQLFKIYELGKRLNDNDTLMLAVSYAAECGECCFEAVEKYVRFGCASKPDKIDVFAVYQPSLQLYNLSKNDAEKEEEEEEED
jgi:transposase